MSVADQALLDTLLPPVLAGEGIARLAWQVGVEAAAPAADAVDQEARFPDEAIQRLREERLLGAGVPKHLGGLGSTVTELAGAVRALAFHCASSALVLAMHSIEVDKLVRHGTSGSLQALLEEVVSEQLLLANANSEVGVRGDVGQSICALEPKVGGTYLEKHALAVSYGEQADAIVTCARRSPESPGSDQIYVVCRRPHLTLERTSTWNTMGLRGTCSMGFRLSAEIDPKMIFPVPFAVIANQGGQLRHILLSAVWVGIAEAAVARAHAYVRRAARKDVGNVPPSALRLTEVVLDVQQSRSLLASAASWLEAVEDPAELESPAFVVALRNLKVATSRLAVDAATSALVICGIEGYRRDSPFSLDRLVRDAHGGLVMVSNDRYLHDNAQLLCVQKQI